ncbi:hypothetical protein OG607_25495 [Streptomyces sp. NBC_01537]|uniref:hypothetical protein n=1 Tax=Streptomyces sp. NBC_01537 TaxID=2903896 RepID=UPI003870C721
MSDRDPDRDPERIVLKPRDVHWDWTGLPMHHLDGDPFLTHSRTSSTSCFPRARNGS